MSRTVFQHPLIKFLKCEENMLLSDTNDSNREAVMKMYEKEKITSDDLIREYTPDEVRMLCERTKVRVKMYEVNIVWNAKKRLDKKMRLENKSQWFVDKMLEKAYNKRMLDPYTESEMNVYKVLKAGITKKDNNLRLDEWHRQRLKAAKASDLARRSPSAVTISSSESESDEEMSTERQPTTNALAPRWWPHLSRIRWRPSRDLSDLKPDPLHS